MHRTQSSSDEHTRTFSDDPDPPVELIPDIVVVASEPADPPIPLGPSVVALSSER